MQALCSYGIAENADVLAIYVFFICGQHDVKSVLVVLKRVEIGKFVSIVRTKTSR